jgi:hypothetical protein
MRFIAPELLSALNASSSTGLNIRFMVELEFALDTVRVHSGVGALQYQGVTWYGVGGYGGISSISQKGDGAATAITFTLQGIPQTGDLWNFLTMAKDYCRQGGPAKFYIAFLDSSGAIIGNAVCLAATLMDVPVLKDDIGEASIIISTEDPLIRQQVGQGLRNTHEDQLHEYPGDLGLEYMAELQDRTL